MFPEKRYFDVVILGGGPAGIIGAVTAASFGATVALGTASGGPCKVRYFSENRDSEPSNAAVPQLRASGAVTRAAISPESDDATGGVGSLTQFEGLERV